MILEAKPVGPPDLDPQNCSLNKSTYKASPSLGFSFHNEVQIQKIGAALIVSTPEFSYTQRLEVLGGVN